MPITKRQFELGIDDQVDDFMRQVYEMLANNKELAYSKAELRDALPGNPLSAPQFDPLDIAIDTLTRITAIEKREVSNIKYYAFSRKFEIDTWEPDYSNI
jgi:hypothetical protein